MIGIVMCGSIYVNAATLPDDVKNAVDTEGIREVYEILFSSDLTKNDVEVLTKDKAENVPVAMVRLDNGKVAYYVEGNAFYPLAVETGWWDTRVDDNGFKDTAGKNNVGDNFKEIRDEEWITWFSDMKSMGFNTVQLMIHWQDWEPQNGTYDFTFLDHVTDLASENGLKTEFIIFLHSQTDNIPRVMDNFWGYDLDNVEISGEKYSLSMQWGNNVKNAQDVRAIRDSQGAGATGIENFLEYWHPAVFEKITNALTELARHYKDSPNIIGYQIGNEEGFNYYVDNGDDKNPYYTELYTLWKADHPNESKDKFRADTINNLWKCFSNAIHEGDPYKPTTTNTQSGNTEKNNITYPQFAPDGMTMDIYKNVDMVGSMFYGNANALYPNLDAVYTKNDIAAYAKGFPILFPTEISASMNDGSVAKIITAQTIARGGQGVGLYCYGEMYSNFEQNNLNSPLPVRNTIITLLDVLRSNIDNIYSAIPVTKEQTNNVYLQIKNISSNANQGNPQLSVLNTEEGNTFGVLHFADNVNQGYGNSGATAKRIVTVGLSAKESGSYQVKIHKTDGTLTRQVVNIELENEEKQFEFETTGLDVAYITVEKTDLATNPENITGIVIKEVPSKIRYRVGETFTAEGLQVYVQFDDGSERELLQGEYEVSTPDMETVGVKTVTVVLKVGDSTFSSTFEISILEKLYESNLTGINFDSVSTAQNALDFLFDGNINVNAHFRAEEEDLISMTNGEMYIQYNFGEKVDLSGIDLYAINGQLQGILEFKLAVQDESGKWVFLDEKGTSTDFTNGREYAVNWPVSAGSTDKVSIDFPTVSADKVRIYITNVGTEWQHYGVTKFAMREIVFRYNDKN